MLIILVPMLRILELFRVVLSERGWHRLPGSGNGTNGPVDLSLLLLNWGHRPR